MIAHALLSASGAHRWMRCTASARLEATFPDTTSDFAKEGTLAHAVAELKLRKYAIEPMSQSVFTRQYNKLKKHELWQAEMDGFTEDYLDYIKSVMLSYKVKPYVVAEKRVDFSAYVPDGFGTADCLILAGDTLHVIDFKYGKGVQVSAEHNEQMMLYALGAIEGYKMLYAFKTVVMAIIQPRNGGVSEFEMYADDLQDWGEFVVKPKAEEAFSDAGSFNPGDHCRFCRAKAQCKARSEYYAAMAGIAKENNDPRLITSEALGTYLEKAKALKAWAEDLQDYALAQCLAGATVPGWKAVEGRGSRSFTDSEAAFTVLTDNGIDRSLLYNIVPLTVAQSEKVVGKKEFGELLADYIVKTPGKPTLAPESDKREAISNAVKAADIFEKVEEK